MKTIFKSAMFAAALFAAAQTQAKTMQKDTTLGQKVGKTATKQVIKLQNWHPKVHLMLLINNIKANAALMGKLFISTTTQSIITSIKRGIGFI